MGVYHFTGLGRSPGAVTAPLTVIYMLLRSAQLGNEEAMRLFRYSGERDQELKGAPEYLIIFTSKEIIEGLQPENQIVSRLFPNEKFSGSVIKIICKYLNKLVTSLRLSNIYDSGWIKKIYLVEVNYQDFNECYPVANTFLYACRDKECWVNSQAGSNQINVSLTIAGSINLASIKYYYVRQTQTGLLDIDFLEPDSLRNPSRYADRLLETWGELQLFGLGISELLTGINRLFQNNRGTANISQLKNKLREHNVNTTFISKLRPFLEFEGDRVVKTDRFDKLLQTYENRWPNVGNTSELWREARRRGILYEVDIQTGQVVEANK